MKFLNSISLFMLFSSACPVFAHGPYIPHTVHTQSSYYFYGQALTYTCVFYALHAATIAQHHPENQALQKSADAFKCHAMNLVSRQADLAEALHDDKGLETLNLMFRTMQVPARWAGAVYTYEARYR